MVTARWFASSSLPPLHALDLQRRGANAHVNCVLVNVDTGAQADFGLSTSDADRVVTKARTGQLQVGCGCRCA